MKRSSLLVSSVITLIFFSSFYFTYHRAEKPDEKKTLFLICENGKWGYIDKAGKVIITLQYYSAQDFSEGLAAVRKEGLYGYIDQSGKFVIGEKYDYAEPFHRGIARVYIDGKPFIIDHSGNKLFEHDYESIGDFGTGKYAPAVTRSGKTCLINIKGKQLTGTDLSGIGKFHEGLSVVMKYTGSKAWRDRDPGVIDTNGNVVVDFGIYEEIYDFSEGLAIAKVKPKSRDDKTRYVCINNEGQVVYEVPRTVWRPSYTKTGYHDGMMVVQVYKQNPDSVRNWNTEMDYPGVVDRNGKILFSNKEWENISNFNHGRAFAQIDHRDWILIDQTGKQVGYEIYDEVDGTRYGEESDVFANGKALVLTSNGWKYIDVDGKVIAKSPGKSFTSEIERVGDNVVIGYNDRRIWIPGDSLLAERFFAGVATWTLKDDLIKVVFVEEIWGYINHKGETLWQSKTEEISLSPTMNADYMLRGYFMASSPYDSSLYGFGGWGSYDNMFIGLDTLQSSYAKGKFQVIIDTTRSIPWFDISMGHTLYIINDSKSKVYFPAENSRIEMIIQAKNRKGEWQDIEYLPHSWCGNSYHTLYLPPKHYWEFSVPKFEGSFTTKLRAKLWCKTESDQKEEDIIYSNEISGSVNPAQFWRKREYFPQGIMDSYNE